MRSRELEEAMLQVVQIMWKAGVELMKIAEHEKVETLYNQWQKKLEEMTKNADQMAEYLKWKVEDLLLSGKTAD